MQLHITHPKNTWTWDTLLENPEDKDFPPPKKNGCFGWFLMRIFPWQMLRVWLWTYLGFPFFLDFYHDGPGNDTRVICVESLSSLIPHFESLTSLKTNSQIAPPLNFCLNHFCSFKGFLHENSNSVNFSGFVWGGASLASRRISTLKSTHINTRQLCDVRTMPRLAGQMEVWEVGWWDFN